MKKHCNCHCFTLGDEYYIFDTYNYIILRVTKKFYEYVFSVCKGLKLHGEQYNHETEVFDEMVRNNYFFSDYSFDKSNICSKNVATLSFAPIYACNLRCKYCFADKRDDTIYSQMKFDKKIVFEVLDWFTEIAFPENTYYRVDFVSGGEPLLNLEAIYATVEYSKKLKLSNKELQIWVCTNGLLLNDKVVKYFDENNISIGVSIDGDEKNHNKNRIDSTGCGTYKSVISQIDSIINNPSLSNKIKDIWALSVVTPHTNIAEVLHHHKRHGIKNAQLKFVRNVNDEFDLYDKDDIIQQYHQVAHELLDSLEIDSSSLMMILNDNDYFGKIVKRIMLKEAFIYRCKAGRTKLTVCPNGDIYPCDSFVGCEDYLLGNIYKEVDLKKYIFRDVLERVKCENCSVKYICGGNCYYDSYIHTNDPNLTYNKFCETYIELCNIALWLVYSIENRFPERYNEIVKLLNIRDIFTKE